MQKKYIILCSIVSISIYGLIYAGESSSANHNIIPFLNKIADASQYDPPQFTRPFSPGYYAIKQVVHKTDPTLFAILSETNEKHINNLYNNLLSPSSDYKAFEKHFNKIKYRFKNEVGDVYVPANNLIFVAHHNNFDALPLRKLVNKLLKAVTHAKEKKENTAHNTLILGAFTVASSLAAPLATLPFAFATYKCIHHPITKNEYDEIVFLHKKYTKIYALLDKHKNTVCPQLYPFIMKNSQITGFYNNKKKDTVIALKNAQKYRAYYYIDETNKLINPYLIENDNIRPVRLDLESPPQVDPKKIVYVGTDIRNMFTPTTLSDTHFIVHTDEKGNNCLIYNTHKANALKTDSESYVIYDALRPTKIPYIAHSANDTNAENDWECIINQDTCYKILTSNQYTFAFLKEYIDKNSSDISPLDFDNYSHIISFNIFGSTVYRQAKLQHLKPARNKPNQDPNTLSKEEQKEQE